VIELSFAGLQMEPARDGTERWFGRHCGARVGRSIRGMQVVATTAQPMLRFEVIGPDRTRQWMTVFTGTVDVVPADSGRRFRVVASDPNGVRVGFSVGDPLPLPIADSVVVAEASVARMPISTGSENTFRYGMVDVAGTLVAAEGQPGLGWPYVQGLLFGGDLTMTIAYRVTVMSPA
jgi:hypothetical protein